MSAKRAKSDLSRVRTLRNLRQVKNFLALSWRDLAALIPKRGGGHFAHSTVMAWADGKRELADTQFNRICQLVANRLTTRYGREVAVYATRNSPWRIKPIVWCDRCGKWHELKRWNQRCKAARG